MKPTMGIPDELYRQVKAKSALEGRAAREVVEELFRRYVGEEGPSLPRRESSDPEGPLLAHGETVPAWFGVLREQARRVRKHDLEAIRGTIARAVAAERGR